MRLIHLGIAAAVAVLAIFCGKAAGGEEVNVYSLNYGMRYCAAPGCDNKEFIETHFGIDAQTGKVTKYVGGDHPYEVEVTGDAAETVLYSSPPMAINTPSSRPTQVQPQRQPAPRKRLPF